MHCCQRAHELISNSFQFLPSRHLHFAFYCFKRQYLSDFNYFCDFNPFLFSMMVPSKFLSFPSTSSTTARRSSIPRLMSKEEKEAMIIDSNDDQVEKSKPMSRPLFIFDTHPYQQFEGNKRYQDLSKKYHAMIKKNQMLAKENAKLLSRQAALKKEKDQLLQVANPVVS